MIGSICSEPKVLEVTRIINLVITIIKIAVPIILIVAAMIDYMNAVKDNDELAKTSKLIVNKLIAAILVFFIPTFVSLIANYIIPNSDYKNCLKTYSIDEIQDMYIDREEEYVSKAEETVDFNDYSVALINLNNIKDETKKEEFSNRLANVKTLIDEKNKQSATSSYSTGYGRDIPVTTELNTACMYIFNEDTAKVRLSTCDGEHEYKNPQADLPGGAYHNGYRYVAKETIPFSQYRKGLFFGEIGLDYDDMFLQTFATMYTTVILKNTIPRQIKTLPNTIKDELAYRAGSCTQNYRQSLYKSRYESGQYKAKIDEVMEATRYFLIVNSDGTLTDVRYNVASKILDAMKNAAKEGKNLNGMIQALKDNHDLKNFYKDANLYDCRNLKTTEDQTPTTTVDKNIIYAGDSRFSAFRGIKSYRGWDDSKEKLYSKVGARYDDDFKSHMSSAKWDINKNKDKTYAVAVNYGVNAKSAYKSFCDYYEGFMKNVDSKTELYLVSVNPFNEKNVA